MPHDSHSLVRLPMGSAFLPELLRVILSFFSSSSILSYADDLIVSPGVSSDVGTLVETEDRAPCDELSSLTGGSGTKR